MFQTYYSADYILEKNAIFNLVLSDRSDGKSFDCKYRALRDYKKSKDITIYMRRYKTELTSKLCSHFFDEVLKIDKYANEFKGWEFKSDKTGVKVRLPGEENFDQIIFFVALSVAGKFKSENALLDRIKIIDFDEFIPLDKRYLSDECGQLLDAWKSYDRDREIVQVLLLGNRITPFNPYFDYFNLDLSITKERIQTYRNGTLAVQIYANKEHREQREKGRFRELIKGTEYEEFDEGGILNALDLKQKSKKDYEYIYSFKTERGEGSVWYNNGSIVISQAKRNDGFILTDKVYNVKRESYVCTYGEFPKILKRIYKTGNMYFEDDKAFYIFEKILTKIGSL